LLADKGVVVTDTDVDSYRGKGKESFRITVAKDFNLTDVDTTPCRFIVRRRSQCPTLHRILASIETPSSLSSNPKPPTPGRLFFFFAARSTQSCAISPHKAFHLAFNLPFHGDPA
jgi:hypothetical protein